MALSPSTPKKTRATQGPRPVFVVLQVLDEQGSPMKFDKDRIKVLSASRNAGEALDLMDGGRHEHATYKKVMVGK